MISRGGNEIDLWLGRIDNDGDRAIVEEFDLHVGLEDAGLNRDFEFFEFFAKKFVKLVGGFRVGGVGETRPATTMHVGVEGKLADD